MGMSTLLMIKEGKNRKTGGVANVQIRNGP